MRDKWYRYEDHTTAPPLDEWDNICGPSGVHVIEIAYPVIKLTPCGAWVDAFDGKRWVKRDARKHFACPTKAEAYESFMARKRRQISILQARINVVERVIIRARQLYGPRN